MSAFAWYCSIMLSPLPTDSAFGLVTEYNCSANQVKPFSSNPSNTWQWSLTNVESKPDWSNQPLTTVPRPGQIGLVLPTEHFVWPELTVCARPAKTEPACGKTGLHPAPYPNLLPLWPTRLQLVKAALELGNLWGGEGLIVSHINLTHTLTIPTRVSSAAAERAHKKLGLQGHTSDSHANWSPRARQQEAGKTPGCVPSGTSPSFLAMRFYLPAWPRTLLGYRRPAASPESMMGYSSGRRWTWMSAHFSLEASKAEGSVGRPGRGWGGGGSVEQRISKGTCQEHAQTVHRQMRVPTKT